MQTSIAAGGRTRLQLDEVASPVIAHVMRRGPGGMTVAQTLPFLRLRSAVRDESGRTAHIADVSVDVSSGTPSLVLELVYDEALPFALAMDDTLPGFEPSWEEGERAAPRARRRDETVPFEIARQREPGDAIVVGAMKAPAVVVVANGAGRFDALRAWLAGRALALVARFGPRLGRRLASLADWLPRRLRAALSLRALPRRST